MFAGPDFSSVLLLTMLMPSSLLCLRLLSCFFIVSLLRQMSIALDNVSPVKASLSSIIVYPEH